MTEGVGKGGGMAEPGSSSKQLDPRTVFVRGIDAAVDDAKLQEFFSEVGPVKKAFLVRGAKGGAHKGFGFVQFAVQEDAARAVTQLHGHDLAGRKLKVRRRRRLFHRHRRLLPPCVPPHENQADHCHCDGVL